MSDERLLHLIDHLLDLQLAESDRAELVEILRGSAEARNVYWERIEQDTVLQEVVRESAGRDLARLASDELSIAGFSRPSLAHKEAPGRVNFGYWLAAGAILLSAVIGMAFAGFLGRPDSLRMSFAPSREPVASLRSLTGDVWLTDAGQQSVNAASVQAFHSGDQLRVGEESAAEVTLTDGTRVVLSADSVLHFQRFDAVSKTLLLERGAADVEAAPQSPARPLIIITQQARLTVLGTQFRLYAGASDSRVELEEGKVQFERQSDGQTVEVAAGQYAVADAEPAKPLVAGTLSSAWRLRQTLHRAGTRVAFSHDGAQLATSGADRVKLWNVATGELNRSANKLGLFDGLAFAPSNEKLVAISDSGKVLHWPLDEAAPRSQELKPVAGNLRSCAVSRDGRWLAQTADIAAGYLPIWRMDDAGEISLVRSIPAKMGSVTITATSQGPRVVAGNWNGATVIWDAETGGELARYRFRSQLFALALSDDGRRLCGYGNATGLLILDTESGEQSTLWPSDSARVNCLRFSLDGRELIAAMADGLVRGWSTETGAATFVLPTGDARVLSLAVSDDGRDLATVGDKGSVKLWQRELPPRLP